jgi:hypothetical protein
LGGFNHRVECCEAPQRYDGEPVTPYWKHELKQLAKPDEKFASDCENGIGAGGEVDLDNGGIDAGILDDPERARLSK